MKTRRFLHAAMAAIMVVALAGCNKDNADLIPENEFASGEKQLDLLVEHANTRYLSGVVEDGREGQPFMVYNDGLIDEYAASEREFTAISKEEGNSFLLCLRSVEPDEDQVFQIRRVLRLYDMRNSRIIENHRSMVAQLQQRMEVQRRNLYRQYQQGNLSEEEYRAKGSELRQRFQEALQRIRENNAEAFSRSYRILLQQLKQVLSDEQWEAFAGCVRS